MGASIRARLSGLRHSEDASTGLTEADLKSALGRLQAYDDSERPERRRRVESSPPLHRRAGLWRR